MSDDRKGLFSDLNGLQKGVLFTVFSIFGIIAASWFATWLDDKLNPIDKYWDKASYPAELYYYDKQREQNEKKIKDDDSDDTPIQNNDTNANNKDKVNDTVMKITATNNADSYNITDKHERDIAKTVKALTD